MFQPRSQSFRALLITLGLASSIGNPSFAQLTDITQTPNRLGAGIQKSFEQAVGAGRGDVFTPDSSVYLVQRDPFRAIVRGRQLFQRKFTHAQGLGPRRRDGVGDIAREPAVGAGLSDSCAACHSRPFGSAGFGGNVFTRPDSRDTPHLFGLGLVEMLGDEITQELRSIRSRAADEAVRVQHPVLVRLSSKGIDYGLLTAYPDGRFDDSLVRGVDHDLRVRPFFAQGKTFAIRSFVVGALQDEMGLQAPDPDLLAASQGRDVTTPSGMLLSGSADTIAPPPARSASEDQDQDGVLDEIPVSLVDYLENYLLHYFPPGRDHSTPESEAGFETFDAIGCADCHVPNLWIERDRRVADVSTAYDPARSNRVFNQLFATATPELGSVDDGSGLPPLRPPLGAPFLVEGIFADFRRHDLGKAFHERNFDGTLQKEFMTRALWGVGSTPPYGHDGRSQTLTDVILRHGGEAQRSRESFVALSEEEQANVLAFLGTLVLFAPPDTSSNLAPADPADPDFPLAGHGSIDLSVLFLDPNDEE
jgi:hypothetical protein